MSRGSCGAAPGAAHLSGTKAKVLVGITGAMMSAEAVRALKDSTKSDKAMAERRREAAMEWLMRPWQPFGPQRPWPGAGRRGRAAGPGEI